MGWILGDCCIWQQIDTHVDLCERLRFVLFLVTVVLLTHDQWKASVDGPLHSTAGIYWLLLRCVFWAQCVGQFPEVISL
jgi:uncharacterized protein Usg